MQDIQEAEFETITEDFIIPNHDETKGSLVTQLPGSIPELAQASTPGKSSSDIMNDIMLQDSLRDLMLAAAEINNLVKSAKTQSKKDFYKKKIAKLQKEARKILYTQYLSGKKFSVESSQNNVE